VDEVRQLNDAVKARGAGFAVVIFRNPFEYGEHVDSPTWDYLATTIGDGLRTTDIALLNLGPILLKTHPHDDLNVHPIDGHPNEIAHRTAANVIRDFLYQERLLPSTGLAKDEDARPADFAEVQIGE
jgi:hypothetical protein